MEYHNDSLNTCESCGVQPLHDGLEGIIQMAVVPWKTGMSREFADLNGIAGTFIMLCEDCISKKKFYWPPAAAVEQLYHGWRIGTYRITSEDPQQYFTVDSNGCWRGNWRDLISAEVEIEEHEGWYRF